MDNPINEFDVEKTVDQRKKMETLSQIRVGYVWLGNWNS